jgi:hypothetical protein
MNSNILKENVNFGLSSFCILCFGLLMIVTVFNALHLENPILQAVAATAQEQ